MAKDMEQLNGEIIAIQEAFKYIQKELGEIKDNIKDLVTQKEVMGLSDRMIKLENRQDKIETEYTQLAIKVASVTGIITIFVQLILDHFVK
jgi:chromosome segregation ATPase